MSKEKTYEFTVVIAGDASVGKTTLTLGLESPEQSMSNSFTTATPGFFKTILRKQYKTMNTSNGFFRKEKRINVMLDVLDTGGQERYISVARSFYKAADFALIVYDITNIESFTRAQTEAEQFRALNENKPVFVIGNKLDIIDQFRQLVLYDEVNDYCKSRGFHFLGEYSAKEKTWNPDARETMTENVATALLTKLTKILLIQQEIISDRHILEAASPKRSINIVPKSDSETALSPTNGDCC